jgi:hypothetical protein
LTWGEAIATGAESRYASIHGAANAFLDSVYPFNQIVVDDGCEQRELTVDEGRVLSDLLDKYGMDVVDVGEVD